VRERERKERGRDSERENRQPKIGRRGKEERKRLIDKEWKRRE